MTAVFIFISATSIFIIATVERITRKRILGKQAEIYSMVQDTRKMISNKAREKKTMEYISDFLTDSIHYHYGYTVVTYVICSINLGIIIYQAIYA